MKSLLALVALAVCFAIASIAAADDNAPAKTPLTVVSVDELPVAEVESPPQQAPCATCPPRTVGASGPIRKKTVRQWAYAPVRFIQKTQPIRKALRFVFRRGC